LEYGDSGEEATRDHEADEGADDPPLGRMSMRLATTQTRRSRGYGGFCGHSVSL
jgi:hypothetical protein